MNQTGNSSLNIFCWNIGNPSVQRAGKQAEWLRQRPENLLVLTEAKRSAGCSLIERYFRAYGYSVVFSKPENSEYGVMIVSKLPLRPSRFSDSLGYLKSRVASAKLELWDSEIEIVSVYVPSRDASLEKIQKKRLFLKSLDEALKVCSLSERSIFCGDLNILEPDHFPRYPFFQTWEYDFYSGLTGYNLVDAFRCINPSVDEYSWMGRTGDGYRYDHCFVSTHLKPFLKASFYLHDPRYMKLSDHSALITTLAN